MRKTAIRQGFYAVKLRFRITTGRCQELVSLLVDVTLDGVVFDKLHAHLFWRNVTTALRLLNNLYRFAPFVPCQRRFA